MLKRYQISPATLGLDKNKAFKTVLLINHTHEDLKLLSDTIFRSVGWFDHQYFGFPEAHPGYGLFALSVDAINELPKVPWVIHVYEGALPEEARFLTTEGAWIELGALFKLSYSQKLLDESDWRVVRELEKLVLPADHPLRLERDALRKLVSQSPE